MPCNNIAVTKYYNVLKKVFFHLKDCDKRSQEVEGAWTTGEDLTAAVVKQVMATVANDPLVADNVRLAIAATPLHDILDHLTWINDCRAKTATQTWSKFHLHVTDWCEKDDLLCSRQARAYLAFQVMGAMLDASRPKLPDLASAVEISTRDEAIIEYIAGYLLRALRTRHPSYLPVTERLTASESSLNNSWLTGVNRGGLITPSEDFFIFVKEMEKIFRSVSYLSRKNFVYTVSERCSLGNLAKNEEMVEELLVFFANWYYLARIHQKCRNQMDKFEQASKRGKRLSKALRDSLN